MTFSDDVLRSYLEGRAEPEQEAAIEAALVADPALEDRLMALDDLAPVLRQGLDLLPKDSFDASRLLQAPASTAPPNRGWFQGAMGFAAGLVLAGGLSWGLLGGARAEDWRADVATYQALYSEATIAPLAFSDAELEAQMAEAEAQIGAAGLYDVVSALPDLRLLRVQVLAHGDSPLIQIVFESETGAPVALCVMAGALGRTDTAVVDREGMASLSFDTADHRWLLIGTEDAGLISETSERLKVQLGA